MSLEMERGGSTVASWFRARSCLRFSLLYPSLVRCFVTKKIKRDNGFYCNALGSCETL